MSICFNTNIYDTLLVRDNGDTEKQAFQYLDAPNKNIQWAINKIKISVPSHGYDYYLSEYNSRKLALERKRAVVKRPAGGIDSRGWYVGNCTSYVAERYDLTHADGWRGDGGEWLDRAAALGKEVSSDPKPGDIMVTGEGASGHVAIVEAVNNDGTVTVSEMNYKGYNVVSERTLSSDAPQVKGYISL